MVKDWGGDHGRYDAETPETTKHVIERYLAPAVEGADAGNFVELHGRMDAIIKGYPYAKGTIELAAYDLVGRSRGLPVYSLLGGQARSRVLVTHSIGLLAIDEAVEECGRVVGEGIQTIKLKIGVDSERDVEIVKRVRAPAGDSIGLCVDANCGYRSPGEAIQTIRAIEPYGLKCVEQPVEGIARIAQVALSIDTPVMADESAWTARDILEIIKRRAAGIISIYTTKPGGLYCGTKPTQRRREAGSEYELRLMGQAIVERQRKAMEAADLDALVASSPENFRYTTGFVFHRTR